MGALVLAALASAGPAQEPTPAPVQQMRPPNLTTDPLVTQYESPFALEDPEIRARINRAWAAALLARYEASGRQDRAAAAAEQHAQAVFQWQRHASRLIFVVVIGIVLSGLALCWLQFRRPGKGKVTRTEAEPRTEVEVGLTGLKMNSPTLGVIVLGLSLAFFYLYLVHVYPITLLAPPGATSAEVQK
jgi:hypothetical protein